MAGGGPVSEKQWILVFDMDDTLIVEGYPGKLIANVVAVLEEGIRQRDKSVKYIFLLTNNQRRWDIETALNTIKRRLPEGTKIFDAIKYLNRSEETPELTRVDIQNIPTTTKRYFYEDKEVMKNLSDVIDLISMCGETISIEELFPKYKIMFFDDFPQHNLGYQLFGDRGKYVQVYPKRKQDFSKELALLGSHAHSSKTRKQSGGSRKNKTKTLKKSKKNKRK